MNKSKQRVSQSKLESSNLRKGAQMKPVKLRYEGCAIEAEILNPSADWPEYRIKLFDPKGQQVLGEEGELDGGSLLEWRLIHAMPKQVMDGMRRRIKNSNAYRRRIIAQA